MTENDWLKYLEMAVQVLIRNKVPFWLRTPKSRTFKDQFKHISDRYVLKIQVGMSSKRCCAKKPETIVRFIEKIVGNHDLHLAWMLNGYHRGQ